MARTTPYSTARVKQNLIEGLIKSRTKDSGGKEVAKQKKKMKKEFEKETQRLYNKAMRKGKSKFGDLLKVGGLAATIFGGPLAAFLVNSAINQYMGKKQQKASKSLLGLDMDRFEKTFLSDAAEGYMSQAEEQQIDSSKVLTDSLLAGGMSALSSYTLGGKDPLGQQMAQAAEKGTTAGKVFKDAFGDLFKPKDKLAQDATGQYIDKAGKVTENINEIARIPGKPDLKSFAAGASTLPMLIAPYTKDWQKSGTNPFEIGKLSKKGIYRDIDRARGKAKRDWRGYV